MIIKSKTAHHGMKVISNIIAFIASGFISINLLIQYSEIKEIKILFGFLAIAFEMGRYLMFIQGKYYWKTDIKKSLIRFFIYGLFAVIVIIGSIGFTLSSLNKQGQTVDSYIIEKDSALKDIQAIDLQIDALIISQKSISNSWTLNLVNKGIGKLREDKKALKALIDTDYSETKINITKSMFGPLGNMFGLSGEQFKILFLFFISLLLEVLLMLTSIDLKDEIIPTIESEACCAAS